MFTSDNGAPTDDSHAGSNYPLRGAKHELWDGGVKARFPRAS